MRVFISCTSELFKHPHLGPTFVESAKKGALITGASPMEMTQFESSALRPSVLCREKVLECDVLIGLIGFRYGSEVTDNGKLSYTELEYETALSSNGRVKPLMFLLDDSPEVTLPRSCFYGPYNDRQEAFRNRLQGTNQPFKNQHMLQTLVTQSLNKLYETKPAFRTTKPEVAPTDPKPVGNTAIRDPASAVGVLHSPGTGHVFGIAWPLRERQFITDIGCTKRIRQSIKENDVVLRWPSSGTKDWRIQAVRPLPAHRIRSVSGNEDVNLGIVYLEESNAAGIQCHKKCQVRIGESLTGLAWETAPDRDAPFSGETHRIVSANPKLMRIEQSADSSGVKRLTLECERTLILGSPLVQNNRVVGCISNHFEAGYQAITVESLAYSD